MPTNKKGDFISVRDFLSILYKSGWQPNDFSQSDNSYLMYSYFHNKMQNHLLELGIQNIKTEHSSVNIDYQVDNEFLKTTEFFGVVSDTKTEFFITQENVGYMNFYLCNSSLHYLQKSVISVIAYLQQNSQILLSNKKINIFAPGSNFPIIEGNLVENILKETLRTNKKDQFLLLVSVFVYISLYVFSTSMLTFFKIPEAVLNNIMTASLTTIGLSIFGLIKTYTEFLSEKQNAIVAWKVIGED
jgi:hypothetical protein